VSYLGYVGCSVGKLPILDLLIAPRYNESDVDTAEQRNIQYLVSCPEKTDRKMYFYRGRKLVHQAEVFLI
jgi:hypothetical protein